VCVCVCVCLKDRESEEGIVRVKKTEKERVTEKGRKKHANKFKNIERKRASGERKRDTERKT
jgi:hypothetical protein